jgi:hypothetical protein
MRKLLLLSLALFSLAASAQSQPTSNSTAQPAANQSRAIPSGQLVTQPTTNHPETEGDGTLYDDFHEKWLDPTKWLPQNPQCWGNVLECVREIRNNKLHLVARNFGARDSDSGIQYSESEVYFVKPNLINSIRADVTASFSGTACPTNSTDYTHTQVQIGGSFFNTGSGNASDDIAVGLIDWIDSTKPTTQLISVYWGYIWPGAATDTFLATYPVGTELTATLKWDKTNHQFIASTKVKDEPDQTAERVAIPYPYPDTTLPASPVKSLLASQHTLNCTSAPTYGQVEATFDNVIVNQ